MLLGGRCEWSLVGESAGENTKMRLRVHLAANLFPVKSAKKSLQSGQKTITSLSGPTHKAVT